jgi:hypothetical protein
LPYLCNKIWIIGIALPPWDFFGSDVLLILGSGRFGIDYFTTKKQKVNYETKTILLALVLSFYYKLRSKTYKKPFFFTLDASRNEKCKKGHRGKDQPLSWGEATEMKLNIITLIK